MKRHRTRKGATTLALILVMCFFVLLPLTIFGFELARYVLMQTQLQAVADAAALSGTAALASAPSGLTLKQRHDLAMSAAELTFEQNTILKTRFNSGNVAANMNKNWSTAAPPLYNAVLNIWLLDQDRNQQATGSTDAVMMRVEARYSDRAVFASSLFPVGLIETAVAVSEGGLPRLDIVLCFDVSGSMDDQTNVVLMKRYWNGASKTVSYAKLTANNIWNLSNKAKEGTPLNSAHPQNVSFGVYGVVNPYIASVSAYPVGNLLHVPAPDNDLRGNQVTYPAGSLPPPLSPALVKYPQGTLVPEQGLPPGNFDPTNTSSTSGNGLNPDSYSKGFTDMIVRVPDVGGFTFPNEAVCVEASRGNLESAAIFEQSRGGSSAAINPLLSGVTPKAGYYDAYWSQVRSVSQPIAAARQAAVSFFDTMNTSCNGHFSIVTFSDTQGTSPTGTWTVTTNKIDPDYPAGGVGAFPLPFIDLDLSKSNYKEVLDAIEGVPGTSTPLVATGATNIADALKTSIDSLTNTAKFRPAAKKAIILFTDGIPNRPVNAATGKSLAFSEADRAKKSSIPIYTIGLSQNPAIKPDQNQVLGDNTGGSGKGIAYRSGNGAIYIAVSNASALNQAFQTIARSLVVLQ